jgi:hypothetical protein
MQDSASKSKRRIKARPPKSWRPLVRQRQLKKRAKRMSWTRKRWQRYHDERAAKRAKPKRPYRKMMRVWQQAEQRDREARSQRMRAYHERRRAALAANSGP